MIVAVTGASGKIGRYVIKELENRNIEYVALSRRKHSEFEKEIISDFDPNSLKDILSSVDGLIHLAGSTNTNNKSELENANVDLTNKIMEAMPDKLQVVFASSISVYGKKLDTLPVTEDTPINPDSDYAMTKYKAEQIVSNHKRSTILRLGTVYGPFDDYIEILRQISEGKAYVIGDGNNHIPFTYVNDVANTFVTAVSKKVSDTFVIVGKEPTQKEVYELAAKYLGVELNYKNVSYQMASLFTKINQLRGNTHITQEHIDILFYDRIFESVKAHELLDFTPTLFEVGLKEVVNLYLKNENK